MGKRGEKRLRTQECANCGQHYSEIHACPAVGYRCWYCYEYGHFNDFCQDLHILQERNAGYCDDEMEACTFDFPQDRFAFRDEPVYSEEFWEPFDRGVPCEITYDDARQQEGYDDARLLQKEYTEDFFATDAMPCNLKRRRLDDFEQCQECPFDIYNLEIAYLKSRVNDLGRDNEYWKKKSDKFEELNTIQRNENEALRKERNDGRKSNTELRKENKGLRKHLHDKKRNNAKLRKENESVKRQQSKERKPVENKCICTEISLDEFMATKERSDEFERQLAEEKQMVKKYQEKLNMYRNSSLNKTLDKLKAETEHVQAENKANKDVITKLKSQQQKLLMYYQKHRAHSDKAVTTIEHLTEQHLYVMDRFYFGQTADTNLSPWSIDRCNACGSAQPHEKIHCVAAGHMCLQCSIRGHFTAVCMSTPCRRVKATMQEKELIADIKAERASSS